MGRGVFVARFWCEFVGGSFCSCESLRKIERYFGENLFFTKKLTDMGCKSNVFLDFGDKT